MSREGRIPPPWGTHAPLILALIAALLIPLPLLAAGSAYTVQLAAFGDAANAEAFKEEVEAKGVAPVLVVEGDPFHFVTVGQYEYFLDAYIVKRTLDARFEQGHPIKTFEFEEVAYTDPLDLAEPVFDLDVENVRQMQVLSLQGNAAYVALEMLDDNPADKSTYKAALLAKLPEVRDDDPLKGYIYVNLGIIAVIDGDYEKALGYFEPVSNGRVASAAAHRVMAMRRHAWIVHQQGDRVFAYQAYRELERFSRSEALRALCRVEAAGLMMELAESGRGNHADVQRLIQSDLASRIPEDQIKHRATMELMYSETYSRQDESDFAKAAQLSVELIEKYSQYDLPELQRELATATTQAGMYFRRAGDVETALKYYEKVLTEFPADVDHFAGGEPHSQALFGLMHIFLMQDRREEADVVQAMVLRDFPDSIAARGIELSNPGLYERFQEGTAPESFEALEMIKRERENVD